MQLYFFFSSLMGISSLASGGVNVVAKVVERGQKTPGTKEGINTFFNGART